jgi:hypothetical protein
MRMYASSSPDRRATPRVSYENYARPLLILAGEACAVLDCSTGGLRYRHPIPTVGPVVGNRFQGTLLLCGGTRLPLSGTILRVYGDVAAAKLDAPGIPSRALLLEHRVRRVPTPPVQS